MNTPYLKIGTTLHGNKYTIASVLGQGGFGITYKAIMKEKISGNIGAMEIEIPVAIKEFFMQESCMRDENTSRVSVPSTGSKATVEQFRHKFVKEANNLASLHHPNIVKVIDVFSENNTDYYVMEYLEGGSLKDLVKNHGSFDEATALQYIYKVGDALNYMHTQKHMCHYDVKPGNIMLDKQNNPKLIDFGISKNYDSEGNQTSSTPVGISKGFAPLEQYQQSVRELSPQTDIYALGATLYYLLTGNVPPEASVVFNEGLPVLPSTISQSTRNAINQAMEPRKKDRPSTMKAFLSLFNGIDVSSQGGNDDKQYNYQSNEETIVELKDDVHNAYGYDTLKTNSLNNDSTIVDYRDRNSILRDLINNMIYVDGGTFMMGDTSGRDYDVWYDEKPTHQVTLSSFRISKFPVTKEDWNAVMNNHVFNKELKKPVSGVSWYDCQEFIIALNKLTNLEFRLPTEAEWEFAAKGGNNSIPTKYAGNQNIVEVAWYDENSGNTKHDVGLKEGNELGLYDMSGNVFEWCQDWYGDYNSDPQTNPIGPSVGVSRVCRGGSCFSDENCCRVSYRFASKPESREHELGFRLAI